MSKTYAALTCVFCGLLGGCELSYYLQAVRGQVGLMAAREPIPRILADPQTPETLRGQLEAVLEIREFASARLALPENGSYRSYADLKRPYVVWNVFAAPEFSVDPKVWCFPFVGCVSYRGYFAEAKAEAFAAGLAREGLDVYVAGIAAYSTLGRFDDPFLNTMLRWDDARTAGLIFHELAHQQLYVKDATAFNEAFATVIEEEGVRRWLGERGDDDAFTRWRETRDRTRVFAQMVTDTRERLRGIYALEMPPEEKRAAKARAFTALRERYAAQRADWDGYAGYDHWFAAELNNAHLSSVATYQRWVPALRVLLARCGGELPEFYVRAAALGELDEATREIRLLSLMAISDSKD